MNKKKTNIIQTILAVVITATIIIIAFSILNKETPSNFSVDTPDAIIPEINDTITINGIIE